MEAIAPCQIMTLSRTTQNERCSAYKKVYRTNIAWGGGAKEHPGRKRDSRQYIEENNNYKLAREQWTPYAVSRQKLLDLASRKHQPQTTKHSTAV